MFKHNNQVSLKKKARVHADMRLVHFGLCRVVQCPHQTDRPSRVRTSHQSDYRIRVCISRQSDCRIRVCISLLSFHSIWLSCTNHNVWELFSCILCQGIRGLCTKKLHKPEILGSFDKSNGLWPLRN